MKLSFAAGEEHNLQLALLALGEGWAVDLNGLGRVAAAWRVLDFERTGAA